tara:strand:+ start:867 stop:1796 length:930 start_codon:yes stop_codon:yes gene_type:complete
MAERKPIPKTQKQIIIDQQIPTDPVMGNPNLATANDFNRGEQTSWKDDNVKPLSIGIQDIDEAVFYYFENVIQPSVIQDGERLPVPIIYGGPEKWKSVQKDGYYRDNLGKIMAPLIMLKRVSIDKNRGIANKLDANTPHNFNITAKKYSPSNQYDQFAVLNNRKPAHVYYASVVPDYVTVTYSCVVFTYYVEQLNKVVEAIQYASDSYWGNPERFQFRAMIDSFAFQTELQMDDERIVRSTFDIKLNGYIVPEILQRDLNGIRKFTEPTKLVFSLETEFGPEFFGGVQEGNRVVTPTSNPDAKSPYGNP